MGAFKVAAIQAFIESLLSGHDNVASDVNCMKNNFALLTIEGYKINLYLPVFCDVILT